MVGWRRSRSRWYSQIAVVEHAGILGRLCFSCDFSGGGVWCFLDVSQGDQYLPNAHQIGDGGVAAVCVAAANNDVLEALGILSTGK